MQRSIKRDKFQTLRLLSPTRPTIQRIRVNPVRSRNLIPQTRSILSQNLTKKKKKKNEEADDGSVPSHKSSSHPASLNYMQDEYDNEDGHGSGMSDADPSSSSSDESIRVEYFESDEELDLPSETDSDSDSNIELSPGSSVPDDADEDDSANSAHNYLPQRQLQSFMNQPALDEPLPEDLDLTYRILDTLQSCGAPLSCFENIVELTRRAHKMQVPLRPISRQKAMKDLRQRFNQNELTPIQTELELPSGLKAAITTIDFCAALGSLLSDPELIRDEHLHLYETENGAAMGEPSSVPPELLVDILDGDVCREAYRFYIKKESDLLVPIIMFIDKTHVDTNGRLTLEPLCFTLGIFKKEYRRQPQYWRTLGFVNTSRDNVELTPGQKLIDYHFVLAHILQSYKEAQATDLQWNLPYRGENHEVTLQIPLLYVVGDTEGHDKLCAHYQNRTKSASLCRYCTCPREETGNPKAKYKKTHGSEIAHLVNRKRLAELKKRSYHCVQSAFHGILFCDPKRGINGATPGELLHVVQHGLDGYLHAAILTAKQEKVNQESEARKKQPKPKNDSTEDGEEDEAMEESVGTSAPPVESNEDPTPAPNRKYMGAFQQPTNKSDYKVMPKSILKMVDGAAKQYGQWLVHQSDREYHRAFFKDGISSTACKQGHEERMVLLLFLILFSSSMFPLFKKAFGSEERLSLYVLVLSHFIMLEDFMKSEIILRTDVTLLARYMPHFLEMFKRCTDREEGMGMNIIKFHLMLHLAEDIQRFGPSTGFDSSFCESMHKMYKLDAQRTQKRTDDSFQYQTAKRSCERIAIACGMRSIRLLDSQNSNSRLDTLPKVRTYGSGACFHTNDNQRQNADGRPLPAHVWRYMKTIKSDRAIRLCSVADIHGDLYRCQWWNSRYDWAYVKWEDWGNVVSRLQCFFDLEQGESCVCAHTEITYTGPGSFALVEAFTQDYTQDPPEESCAINFQAHSASSLLFKMDLARDDSDVPQLFCVRLDTMVTGPAAVIPFDHTKKEHTDWMVIAPKWERKPIFRANMVELIQNSRKRK